MELLPTFKPMPFGGWDPLGVRPRFGTYRGAIRLVLANLEDIGGGLAAYKGVRWEIVQRLVFVCWGNICRSPYAEYRARSLGLSAVSFGLSTSTGARADAIASRVAARRGVDMASHRTCDAGDFEIRAGDLLFAMEPRQAKQMIKRFAAVQCQFTLLGLWSKPRRVHIHDPHQLSEAYFDRCYSVIDTALVNIAKFLPRSTIGDR